MLGKPAAERNTPKMSWPLWLRRPFTVTLSVAGAGREVGSDDGAARVPAVDVRADRHPDQTSAQANPALKTRIGTDHRTRQRLTSDPFALPWPRCPSATP